MPNGQIERNFIEDNAVDGPKIRLDNGEALRSVNAAGTSALDLLKLDASDILQLLQQTNYARTVTGSDVNEILNVAYLNSKINAGLLANSSIVATTPFTTSSATDVVITGFTLTPASGTYLIWYNAAGTVATNAALLTSTIYKAGSALTDSARVFRAPAANTQGTLSSMTVAQFNGSQACDVRVKSSSGSITVNGRALIMLRIGV